MTETPRPSGDAARSTTERLAQRYRRKPPASAIVLMAILGLVIVGLVVWLVWAVGVHANPKVTSALETWTADSENSVTITADVGIHDAMATNLRCTVSVLAEDHTTVGYASFQPIEGRQSVVIRTERLGTSVNWTGCTAEGQNDPQ